MSVVVGVVLASLTVAVALFAPLLAVADPFALSGPSLSPPTLAHPMGTDALGRDVYSGVVYGARASLSIALGAGVLALLVGTVVGTISGFWSGIASGALMRVTELFQVMPRFLLIVLTATLFGAGNVQLACILGLTAWPTLARVTRAEILTLRESNFVLAARAAGASSWRILWRELMPSVIPTALIMLGLLFAQLLLVQASLAFLGVSDPNTITWGALAAQAQSYLRVAWWLPLFPGLAITLGVLGFNLLSDAYARRFYRER